MFSQNPKGPAFLTQAGIIAALYAALTYASSLFGLAYGEIQFRVSEALMVLALFTPAAPAGLTIGCVIGNLGSPFGLADIIIGSFATLIAAYSMYFTRHIRFTKHRLPLLPLLFPVLSNALFVGLEISYFMPEGLTFAGFLAAALSVGIGEFVVCYALGIPLDLFIQRRIPKSTGEAQKK